MRKVPKVLSSRIAYDGWLKLRVDTLGLNHSKYNYDVIIMGDGVAVLPFLDRNTVLLARQYRHPVKSKVLELIQGGVGKNESPCYATARELLEETGYAARIHPLNTIYPIPGTLDMRLHLFTADNMKKITNPDNNELEEMQLIKMSYKQLLDQIRSTNPIDSALVSAVLYHELGKK